MQIGPSKEELRIEKQTFVNNAIVGAGMNQESFFKYLEAIRRKFFFMFLVNGINIDSWTLDELKAQFEKFKILQSENFNPAEICVLNLFIIS